MMKNYDHKKIESKVQKEWEKKKIYQASSETKNKKFYGLIEFPYPSGDGLHVGHPRPYIGMDVISRKRRMEGFNVLYPIGWDAFGLPTENYAIKTGKKPAIVTKKNIETFTRQIKMLGISFDWSREVNTTDPKYYKWTQWIFLQFFKKGLAYKAKSYINWCPKDKIGLANEEAIGGVCERCGSQTEKREKEQWMLAITKYADRLDKDLDLVDYPARVKTQQRNWIGKSEGAEISFKVESGKLKEEIKIFTTRPDTIFGATFIAVAGKQDKFTGKYVINPATKEKIPVWEAEYVMEDVGTGAVMGVPAHDERDWDFAKKHNLSIKPVIIPQHTSLPTNFINMSEHLDYTKKEFVDYWVERVKLNGAITQNGLVFNSGKFSGLDSEVAKKKIIEFVDGKMVTKYKLRDWIFSRQRYWGEPIPLVFCENCRDESLASDGRKQGFRLENAGWVPVPEKDLPVKLPEVKSYKPTDTGESPLASISKWVNVKCPKCKGKAKRETDTMPNWAGSSWYYLRYADPKNSKEFASKKNLKYWLGSDGVDWYNGGMEHTTLHLLYSRFWHKFLYDLKLVPTVEPYHKRTSHGMILGEGGVKMSKSVGNVVNPDDIVKTYGADTLRVYEMFMGPFEESVAWSTESIIGSRRFIEKVWRIGEKIIASPDAFAQSLGPSLRSATPSQKHAGSALKNSSFIPQPSLQKLLHKTIKKVSEDIETMRFNTAISAMMILATEMESAFAKSSGVTKKDYIMFLQILAPFAPHIAEDMWANLGERKSIHLSNWPIWDESLIKDNELKIAVQINGKVRTEIIITRDEEEESVKEKALVDQTVLRYLAGGKPRKIIYVKNRVINILTQ